jgi:hypothetical protein
LDAAKKGCLARVQKLCTPENINCRDTQGRNSTPLHLAGKYHQCFQISFSFLNAWYASPKAARNAAQKGGLLSEMLLIDIFSRFLL